MSTPARVVMSAKENQSSWALQFRLQLQGESNHTLVFQVRRPSPVPRQYDFSFTHDVHFVGNDVFDNL